MLNQLPMCNDQKHILLSTLKNTDYRLLELADIVVINALRFATSSDLIVLKILSKFGFYAN